MSKPTIIIDFDGVLHSYTSGWSRADEIKDGPVPGAFDFLKEATKHFQVCIVSSRTCQAGGIVAMREWLERHCPDRGADARYLAEVDFPKVKPPAIVTIDDRAICFKGVWPSIAAIKEFKPWNKR